MSILYSFGLFYFIVFYFLLLFFFLHQSLREMPETSQQRAWLEVPAGVRRICRIRIRYRVTGWQLETALDADTTSDCVMDGNTHARAGAANEKPERSCTADDLENVSTCTFGTKGRDGNSRNVLLPWAFDIDLMWRKPSRLILTSAWVSWRRKGK